jgi:hypothetical protein
MGETMTVKRPGVVTFVGVVLYIKAAIAAVIGIALLIDRGQLEEVTGQSSDALLVTAIVELILAVLLFLVALAIMSGAKWARLAVAIVYGIRIAAASWWMITHIGGPFQWNAIIQIGVGIFVLWALYGNDKANEYFEGYA